MTMNIILRLLSAHSLILQRKSPAIILDTRLYVLAHGCMGAQGCTVGRALGLSGVWGWAWQGGEHQNFASSPRHPTPNHCFVHLPHRRRTPRASTMGSGLRTARTARRLPLGERSRLGSLVKVRYRVRCWPQRVRRRTPRHPPRGRRRTSYQFSSSAKNGVVRRASVC